MLVVGMSRFGTASFAAEVADAVLCQPWFGVCAVLALFRQNRLKLE
jgi:hypothetical protein